MLHEAKKRADDWQLRIADRITVFAGSMAFVWVHVAIFAFWIGTGLFGHDRYPFQFLTFVVSLEAIFLSTFVMIGQNREAAFQQAKADHDSHAVDTELDENTELGPIVHANHLQLLRSRIENLRNSGAEITARSCCPRCAERWAPFAVIVTVESVSGGHASHR